LTPTPVPARSAIFSAGPRSALCPATFYANHALTLPPSPYLQFRQVARGFDVADNEIAARVQDGDLVVTQDIPLAADVVEKGALAVSPRGERFTPENVRARLAMRDFMTELRDSGVRTGGPPPLDATDRQRFANVLDRWLAQLP
jgi:uncharacterized protein YaiI (UPF0178 family)